MKNSKITLILFIVISITSFIKCSKANENNLPEASFIPFEKQEVVGYHVGLRTGWYAHRTQYRTQYRYRLSYLVLLAVRVPHLCVVQHIRPPLACPMPRASRHDTRAVSAVGSLLHMPVSAC